MLQDFARRGFQEHRKSLRFSFSAEDETCNHALITDWVNENGFDIAELLLREEGEVLVARL